MGASFAEPVISPRLRRPLVAACISLGVHAALIALLQVAPPAPVSLGEPAIEARLVPAHAREAPLAPQAEKPDEPAPLPPAPRPARNEARDAPPLAAPPEQPAAPPAVEPEPAAEARTGESVAEPQPLSPPAAAAPAAAITSAVDLTYYSVSELDVQPRPLREIVPDYPADADRRRLSGKVRLQLELEADGRLSDIEVVSATPPGVFEASAVKALREARFAPAQKNGRPVRARVVIVVMYDWEGRARQR